MMVLVVHYWESTPVMSQLFTFYSMNRVVLSFLKWEHNS